MKNKNRIHTYDAEAGFNISWGSILAGVVTFIAMLLTFSLIGSAIGFGMVEPTSANPLDGVGTGVLIWTVVAFVLSLGAAGFVAGLTSRRLGFIHGFLTWATGVIAFVAVLSFMTVGAFSTVGSTLGSIFSVAGQGVETVASGSGDLIASGFNQVVGEVQQVDTKELEDQTTQILEDTDIPELQPNYINNQLNEASTELANAGKEIVLNPENAEEILQETMASLEEKATTIANAADKEAIANAVNANTDLTEAEAEEAVDNIYASLQDVSVKAEEELQMASQRIDQAQVEIDQMIEDARVEAEKAADATAKASMWGFIALVLGLLVTSFAGFWASNLTTEMNEEQV